MLEKKIILAEMNPELVSKEIGDFILETIINSNATGAVVGLSGGVDSTAAAALAKKAFDEYNYLNPDRPLELVGYILPSNTNAPIETDDGIKVAEKLGIRYERHSIESIIQAYQHTNSEALKVDYHKANLMSRIRANILSTKSATERKPILGTGNKDEDFGVGYYTLFGDGAVHTSPIGNLSKRLVYQMARYLGFDEIAGKEPTAGLVSGVTDRSDLGYGYDVVELVIEGIAQGFSRNEVIKHSQVKEMIEPQLVNNPKFSSVETVVVDVLNRHYNVALPKAEIIHPPIAKITLEYREVVENAV
jgi:NAD+ synthase